MIGIFGGTFDPIHLGHRGAVDQLVESLEFERVYWVLSARPPHKNQVSSEVEHRYEMLKLALQDQVRYVADDTEIKRADRSYTIDTVESFKRKYPKENIVVIIGADSLSALPKWHRYNDLLSAVNWVAMYRPGYSLKVPSELSSCLVESAAELNNHNSGKIWLFESSNIDVSSTQLRHALSQPKSANQTALLSEYISPKVRNYIETYGLYQPVSEDTADQTNLYTRSESSVLDKFMNPDQVKDQVVDALEDVKGQDIKVLDIADVSNFADYMIVASGTSDTHVKALARSASDKLRKAGVKPLNEDGSDVGEWVLVDFGDVVLHVMRPEVRAYYDLEKLWDEDVRKMVEQHREERDD